MAGLDFQDCFLHWKIHPTCRRLLGVRHPITRQFGVFLFMPFGLGPAPGINDRNISQVIVVCKRAVKDIEVSAFVDDLRLTNANRENLTATEDKEQLALKLWEFKDKADPIQSIVVLHSFSDSVVLQWDKPCDNNVEIVLYNIYVGEGPEHSSMN